MDGVKRGVITVVSKGVRRHLEARSSRAQCGRRWHGEAMVLVQLKEEEGHCPGWLAMWAA
jgi:hypothetical protein